MLIILAGITLNAVIGEDGIIFQAKDTKNMISNETQYDNQQLAQLQNELKDNELYSGIGIIPGTDIGGGSEGGENGTTNQGGQTNSGTNQGGSGTNTGENTNTQTNVDLKPINNQNNQKPGGEVSGETAADPSIKVLAGEEVAASFYRSDVTIQIFTEDKTQRIKYILATTIDAINDELYPSGLVKELDIENGGTLTFTKDGEYTITAYAYDVYGQKSNATVMWLKRETQSSTKGGITVTVSGGNMGQNNWYTSNVTLRVLGTDTGSTRVTYRVQGNAYSTGMIGNLGNDNVGNVDTGEQDIANGTTFRITMDGDFTVTAYTYDAGGMRLSSSEVLKIKKDSTRPVVNSYIGEQVIGSGFKVTVDAKDVASGLTSNAYNYRHKESSSLGEYTSDVSDLATKTYSGLDQKKTYDMYVVVTDQAGNMAITDIVSRPSLWVESGTAGETSAEGKRSYYRSNVEVRLRGQDSNNVDITKTTYQVIGTPTGEGSVEGNTVTVGNELTTDEKLISDKETKIIQLQADGDWKIRIHNYNKEGKLVTTNSYEVTRDIVVPTITAFAVESASEKTAKSTVTNSDFGTSGQATGGGYIYYLGGLPQQKTTANPYTITGLTRKTDYSTFKVVAKDKAGNETEMTPTDIKYYLVDRAVLMEYVAYNAGTWASTVANPSGNNKYGGYTKGKDKSTSLYTNTTYYDDDEPTSYNGWRVLKKTGSGREGSVLLVSAGWPVKGSFGSGASQLNTMITGMGNFANNNFVNSEFVESARSITKADIDGLNSENQEKLGTCGLRWGPYFWTADKLNNGLNRCIIHTERYYASDAGPVYDSQSSRVELMKIVISVKTGTLTGATNNVTYQGEKCWKFGE